MNESGEHLPLQMPAALVVPIAYFNWSQVILGALPSFNCRESV
jgi:hypothetical protein